jgi:hypothetical protein
MKKFLIVLLFLFPILCFSQILTLKSYEYNVDRGGDHSRNISRSTKIKIYENKIKFIYADQVIPISIKVKNMAIVVANNDFYMTAEVDDNKEYTKFIVLYLCQGKYEKSYKALDVEHKNYIQTFIITEVDKRY